MSNLKELNQDDFGRKIIRDLGRVSAGSIRKDTGRERTKRMAILQCGKCGKQEKLMVTTSTKNSSICKECTHRKDVRISDNPLYKRFYTIKNRCYNPNSPDSKHYLKRGITVCEEWISDWRVFEKWALSNGFKSNLEIDRIDNDKGYSPDNCRWVERAVNVRNTRKLKSTNSSGSRGVVWHITNKKYCASIQVDGVKIHLGSFDTKEEAAIEYDNYVLSNNLEHTINGVK